MHPTIIQALANAHIAELRRTAEAANRNHVRSGSARRRIDGRWRATGRSVGVKLRPSVRRQPCPILEEL